MSFDQAVWPSNCPPSDAIVADQAVFRLVKDNPPKERSFRTHFERGRGTNCPDRALSVYSSEDGAREAGRQFPGLGKWIARAHLHAQHGVLKADSDPSSTHMDWWLCDHVTLRAGLFSVAAQV
jgi:hypothetical protein